MTTRQGPFVVLSYRHDNGTCELLSAAGRIILPVSGSLDLHRGMLADFGNDGKELLPKCDLTASDGCYDELMAVAVDVADAVSAISDKCKLLLQLLLVAAKNKPSSADPYAFLVKFLTDVFKTQDMRLNFNTCKNCSLTIIRVQYIGFDPERYEINCSKCRSGSTFDLTPSVAEEWARLSASDYSAIATCADSGRRSLGYVLFLLYEAFVYRYGEVASISKYLQK